MSISIASHDREWVERCNAQARERAERGEPIFREIEYYWTDTDYGLGVSIWELDDTRVLVAQDLLAALQTSSGSHGRVLGDYVDIYLTGTEQIGDILEENGYGEDYWTWLTPELAAPPIPNKET